MPSAKNILVPGVLVLLVTLNGCANRLIEVRQGAERVALMEASQVASCKSKGTTTVSVLAQIGFINRGVDAVEANLLQLARNSAIDSGGDTLVKGNSTEYGRRSFEVFRCAP